MNKVPVQFLDRGFHRVLFDAMPMPVFVVDRDVSILEYNSAAAKFVGPQKRRVVGRRGGDVLHCLHATETPEGCGRAPACENCVVRDSVRAAFEGEHVNGRWARMELADEGRRMRLNLRVSCQPFTYQRHSFALLILEGLND